MPENSTPSFFTRLRERVFNWMLEREIYQGIFSHLNGEKNCGYPFKTDVQLVELADQLDVQPLLETIERNIRNMPEAYGASFRYIMHRDLQKRLRMYERLARRRVQRECDPRFVATGLETFK